jgi:transcriptional regulator with XRE-family HTH domain
VEFNETMLEPVDNDARTAPSPSQVGARLRAERERLGLSLRDLARRVGVSASLISQIERDKVNPSVSTLYSLATSLGLTMGQVFDERAGGEAAPGFAPQAAADAGPVATPDTRPSINLGSGVRWERLTASPDPLVDFVYLVYDVGSSSAEEVLLTHPGKEYGYVLSGELGVRIGFDEYRLRPGDSISFDSSAPHRLWAVGTTPVHAIWFALGRQGELTGTLAALAANGVHHRPQAWT